MGKQKKRRKNTNGDSTMAPHHCSLDMTQVEAPLDEQQVGQTSPSDVLQLKIGQASPTDVLQVDVGSALIREQPPTSPTDALLSPVSASINRLRRAPRCGYTSPRWARANVLNEADDSGRAREPRQFEIHGQPPSVHHRNRLPA